MLNTLGIRLTIANVKWAKNLAKLSMSLVHRGGKGSYCFLTHSETWLIGIHEGWMEFLIRILILFHPWLIIFFSQNACIRFLASRKQPLMFKVQSRWREDIRDRAECDLITGHLLASDLKKINFVQSSLLYYCCFLVNVEYWVGVVNSVSCGTGWVSSG